MMFADDIATCEKTKEKVEGNMEKKIYALKRRVERERRQD